jgi:MFS family permease
MLIWETDATITSHALSQEDLVLFVFPQVAGSSTRCGQILDWVLVGALQFLPVMVFSLFDGVLADRLPKRTMLLITQSSALLQAIIMWILVVTGTVQIWQIMLLAALLGLTNALDTPTRQAFVVEMVGREDLPNAIALNSSLVNMARALGPGLGSLSRRPRSACLRSLLRSPPSTSFRYP